MKAVLITIGDEILSGDTVDTNSNFIAGQLKMIGIPVIQILTVADDVQTIKGALNTASSLGDLIFTTGGLGPTKDDRTKTAFAQFFGDELALDETTFLHLQQLFIKRKREHLLELNRPQAMVLSRARIFQNENGTAPCMMMEQEGKLVFCLPGVPYEVKPLITDKIIPYLILQNPINHLVTRSVSVVGIPESLLSEQIEKWEMALPPAISLSYLPVGNRIKLRLNCSGPNLEALNANLDTEVKKLQPLIGKNVISWNGNEIQEILKDILVARKLTISSAESCTGGALARLITSVPGSSAYFLGGVIPYDYQKKIKILGVSPQTIAAKTAVSAEVAQEMTLGCRDLFDTDIALSTTGVAGPNTDEFDNEVGTVYYSIRTKSFEKTQKLHLPHLHRNDFAQFVSQRVLQDLVEILVNTK
ncbi:CinA family nicotinamide mononucleotide deamidase-related protein [Chryseobacterium sp. cx-311]|uniref:CinA family nicotinamide mononucleotide deamidase-related protein n=1 Tax=Marnyiella aurantia TaxID=2758037 RepID=UPI001AE91B85|nr:CinA family nicotinamide mononucleotide deamidase-related protein [Marnyiella aurantia]MBP0612900.1 CinA family nicotinamide mononucleotide deamidase-related protein [Marnyiella aurantia]